MTLPITVVWDFNPVFFSIGSFDIRYYGLMWVLAILGGMLFFDQVCKREGLPQKVSESIFVYGPPVSYKHLTQPPKAEV